MTSPSRPFDRALGKYRLLIRAFLWLAAIRLGLWAVSFDRLRSILKKRSGSPRAIREVDPLTIRRIGWSVKTAGRFIPRGNCLPQALAAQVLLARLGEPARLCLGTTRNEDGRLEAHAWLECRGQIVVGGADPHERYTRLPAVEWELL